MNPDVICSSKVGRVNENGREMTRFPSDARVEEEVEAPAGAGGRAGAVQRTRLESSSGRVSER